jgi:hypothetical protein
MRIIDCKKSYIVYIKANMCVSVRMYVCSTVSKQLKDTTIKTSTVSFIVEAVA